MTASGGGDFNRYLVVAFFWTFAVKVLAICGMYITVIDGMIVTWGHSVLPLNIQF